MAHGTPTNSAPPTRKRKWKATNVVRIDFGDDMSEDDTATAVVHQASRDGRRVARKFHHVPIPRDLPTPAAPYFPSAEEMGFTMDVIDQNDEENEPSASVSPQVSSSISVPFVRN